MGSWAGWGAYLGIPHLRDSVVVQAAGHELQLRGHHNQALESFQQTLQCLSNHLQEPVVPTEKEQSDPVLWLSPTSAQSGSEWVRISVQGVKLLHAATAPFLFNGVSQVSPGPKLLTGVAGDADQSPQDRDQLKAVAGTTQLLAWAADSTAVLGSEVPQRREGAGACTSPLFPKEPAQDMTPQGFYLMTSCTSTVFMDSS